jgi:hypothetical protein
MEQMEQQTRVAAVAVVGQTIQLLVVMAVSAVAELPSSAIPAHQLPLLLVQQTQQHNPAASPSIHS